MRRILVSAVVAAVLGGPLLAAHAGPVPSMCEIQRLLGYENVKECENPDS